MIETQATYTRAELAQIRDEFEANLRDGGVPFIDVIVTRRNDQVAMGVAFITSAREQEFLAQVEQGAIKPPRRNIHIATLTVGVQ